MKKQLIGTVLAACLPMTSFALPPLKNNYTLPLNKSQQVENPDKSLGSNKSESSKIKAIIEAKKLKLKTQGRPEKSGLIGNHDKAQFGRLKELFREHDFVKAFIAGGYSGR